MNERPHKVYVLTDSKGRILDINSGDYLADTSMWTQIDEGYGDRYHHAQGHYLPKKLYDERGIYRYKLVDGQVVERTKEEMDADWVEPEKKPTDQERIEALEKDNATLKQDNTHLKEALDLLLSGVTE